MFQFIQKASAAITVPTISPTTGSLDPKQIVTLAVNWVLYFAGAVAIIYLLYGGILYITAGGDAEKATKGRTALINAVIGIAIIFFALAIIRLVTQGSLFTSSPV
jgi:hypothetical protein